MTSKTRRKKQTEIQDQVNEEVSLIAPELERFQKQVNEILASMESINLLAITETEDKLAATKTKLDISLKLPQLLSALDDLKNRAKIKGEDIKGNKTLSPLEDGTLDDEDDI